MRMTNVDTVSTYFAGHSVGGGNIVTTGALDSGSITSGFGAIDNGTSNIRSATITAETAFVPDAANGATLGTASLEFADMYLHDGGIVYFGADQDVELAHVADVGLTLKTATTSDDTKATLTLQTGDTDIAANDVLGQLHFQAPDEGAGTDAILVAAGIAAISEGDFSASNNATKLSFQTGASEAASEKMSLSSAGLLTIADDLIIGDGKTIGSASDPDAMSIASGGAVTFTQTPVFPDGSLALADLDIDGGTDIGAAIVDADLFIIDDGAGGTNRKTAASRLKTYIGGVALSGSTNNQVATVTGANALTGESNLLFTGNTLTVGASDNGLITATHSLTIEVGGAEKIDFNTTDSSTNRIRIVTGGNVLVGDGTDHGDNTGRLQVTGRASSNIARFRAGTNGEQISFHNSSNTQVGTITLNASATAYATSSDYRLKENVDYTFDATTRLKQLKPARFNWIADEDNTLIDGFIAHEVSSVVPEAVTGIHNAVEVWKDNEELPEGVSVGDNKLDDDGNTIPKYQGIDQSKLVPLLVKTIQELEARIKTLEDA